jgi:uncharacterized protein
MSFGYKQVLLNSEEFNALDFGRQVFNNWGIGSAEKNNGILIMISVEDRDFRIITGKGA